ncbi:anti-sigma factor [Hoeflea sp. CAU 1731]
MLISLSKQLFCDKSCKKYCATCIQIHLEAAQVPDNQVMQVWTKPDSDGPPVSPGLLPFERSGILEVEGLPSPAADQLYEITFEPEGGSPTNVPTGPVLGKGFAKSPVR